MVIDRQYDSGESSDDDGRARDLPTARKSVLIRGRCKEGSDTTTDAPQTMVVGFRATC